MLEHATPRREVERPPTPQRPRPVVRRSTLRVGAADDAAEREADRIADRVVATLGPSETSPAPASRIRRSSAPPGAMGLEGGELGADVAARVRAAQGGGRPLGPSVRAPMERAFGTDFGRIRLHEGREASALNDELGARAFTLGRDIFVREPIQAERTDGQRLLAHELAHTVQNGADSARRTIRRDVGFEFEVGSWTLDYIDQATAQQTSGNAPFTDADIDNGWMTKDRVIHAGRGFNLKPDQADDGTWHIEFVVEPPFKETSKGRSGLERTMKDLRAFTNRLIKKGASASLTRTNSNVDFLRSGDVGCTEPWVLITPRDSMQAEPQMTAGIRLDQLGAMMTKMMSGALPGETAPDTASRRTGATYMAGKGDQALVGQSPTQVRNLFGTFVSGRLQSPTAPSEELVSYLAMVRTYLMKASATMAYAKSLAPIMARTDFGAMFASLPEAPYYRTYPDEFANLALHVSGMTGQGGQPFFTGASTYTDATDWAAVQAALTRTQWLRDVTQGIDRVTIDHFPDQNVAGYLFGFGSKKGKTDTVGKLGGATETQAPIFELRRMIGHVDHRVWATMALELFDFMVALNRQQSPTFTGRKTDTKVANL